MTDYIGVEGDGPGRCEFVIFRGSPNPESANFGPDEQCEEDGDIDGFCKAHAPWVFDD